MAFDPSRYGPTLGELLRPPRLPELGRGRPVAEMADALRAFVTKPTLTHPVVDSQAATALAAGLYLHFDFWHESHELAQTLDTPEGAYWHAILHRREPDPGNAKYWFRELGRHPVADQMAHEPGYGSAVEFVELAERVRGSGGPLEQRARELQRLEWQRLFEYCHGLALRLYSAESRSF